MLYIGPCVLSVDIDKTHIKVCGLLVHFVLSHFNYKYLDFGISDYNSVL